MMVIQYYLRVMRGYFQSGRQERSTGSAYIKYESENTQIRLLAVLFGHSDMQLVSEHPRPHRAQYA